MWGLMLLCVDLQDCQRAGPQLSDSLQSHAPTRNAAPQCVRSLHITLNLLSTQQGNMGHLNVCVCACACMNRRLISVYVIFDNVWKRKSDFLRFAAG